MNNVIYFYCCPKCGYYHETKGSCPQCGWQEIQNIIKTAWICPKCGRCHAPHMDTCPFCLPFQSYYVSPYITSPYIYIDYSPFTITSGNTR
jgi:rubrerythrin